jgi:hypothetical protein
MKVCCPVLVVFIACLIVRSVPTNRVTILNESGQPVHNLRIEFCGGTINCGDVPTGGSASARFGTPEQDDYLTIRCRLNDGTAIYEPCVSVAWEEYFSIYVIVIRGDGSTTVRYE